MRITNDMRTAILNAALTGVFKERQQKLDTEGDELAKLVYDQLYPTDIQTIMQKLPSGYFREATCMYYHSAQTNNKHRLMLKSSRRISAADDHGWNTPAWLPVAPSNLTARMDRLVLDRMKLDSDKATLKSSIQRMLAGISTLKRLEEEWPDGSAYYSEAKPAPPTQNVPAIRGADITKMIMELGE